MVKRKKTIEPEKIGPASQRTGKILPDDETGAGSADAFEETEKPRDEADRDLSDEQLDEKMEDE
jgi:hypothetical protein